MASSTPTNRTRPVEPSESLVDAAAELAREVEPLRFSEPVTHVYNPLVYAWAGHERYIRRFGIAPKRVVMIGMNPGPWGMAQTGVPFGDAEMVGDWLGIREPVGKPKVEHPKRLVQGLDCPRSEVSGQRLWGLFRRRFVNAEAFFAEHYVANYCPLMFVEAGGRNRTPDKLPADQRQTLSSLCQRHLQRVIEILKPADLVAIGTFAESRLRAALADHPTPPRVTRILHPSPASPAANRDWAGRVTAQLTAAGVW